MASDLLHVIARAGPAMGTKALSKVLLHGLYGWPCGYMVFIFLLLVNASSAQQASCRNGTRIRLLADGVRYGCSALAQSYGLQSQELLLANVGQVDCDNLTVGQILCIPHNPRTDPSTCSKAYKTVPGDTCEGIAGANGYGTPAKVLP